MIALIVEIAVEGGMNSLTAYLHEFQLRCGARRLPVERDLRALCERLAIMSARIGNAEKWAEMLAPADNLWMIPLPL